VAAAFLITVLAAAPGIAAVIHANIDASLPAGGVSSLLPATTPRVPGAGAAHAADSNRAGKSVFVVIPQGHRAVAVHLVSGGAPFQVSHLETGAWSGYQIASFVVRPLPGSSSPATPVQLQVSVDTEPADRAPLPLLRVDPEGAARARERLRRFVANPEGLDAFAPPPPPAPTPQPGAQLQSTNQGPHGFVPTAEPSIEGSPVRFLIITTDALAPAFEPLADWRTRRGIPAQIRTLEWIASRTRQGIDAAETLRNFLVEAYQLWGVEWVLLGGDSHVVPARYARTPLFDNTPDEFTPTDMYFACLDGTWNEDRDATWGEGSVVPNTPGEADMLPELHVARFPVSQASEVTALVNKVIDYEGPVHIDYQQKVAFLSEVLFPVGWDSTQVASMDGAVFSENMIANSLTPGTVPLRYYDTHYLYPGSTKLTKSAALAQMNLGAGIVNHLGHGHRYNMSCGNLSVINADADALTNVDRSFVLFMANCTASAFDFNCLSKSYLRNPSGGAAAVVGVVRTAFADFVVLYNQAFMRQLYEHDQLHVAEILDSARLERTASAELEGEDRHMHFSLNALGDPAMRVFSGPVATTTAVHANTITAGPSTLPVSVTANALPVSGATVCAFKDGEVYAVGQTDVNGEVDLIVSPQTAGVLSLNVSGKNITSVQHSVTVQPSAPALVRLASFVIDDDSVGPTSGNGDGRIDAGETVGLTLSLQNTGGATASNVAAVAASSDAEIVVAQNTASVTTLTAGETEAAAAQILLEVSEFAVDGSAFELDLGVTASGGGSWDDALHVDVSAPRIEVLRVAAQPQGGNSLITVQVKNYGSGQQVSGSCSISAQPPVQVINDNASLAAVPAFGTGTVSPAFQINTGGGTGTGLTFSFTDTYGRLTTHRVDLVPTAAPVAPTADIAFSSDLLRLHWTPPAGTDLLGYHVFRAGPSQSFQQLTPDIILHSEYHDTDVEANTLYQYYVVAVDSSRQWSAPSPTMQVNTSAAALDGWPRDAGAPTASSVAVGDIDGDLDLEVVIGTEGVWAWHADGTEVRDGDGLPTTDGLFTTLAGTVSASVALAEMNGQPGLELIIGPWGSNSLYVMDAAGNVLPGWPRTPNNGGAPGYFSSPSVGDIDSDGQPEVAAVGKDGWLYVWHHNGTPLVPGDGKVRYLGAWTQGTPALYDLTGDGNLEIICTSSVGTSSVGVLYVLRSDGTDLPGWPISLVKVARCSPAIGDVDGDGTPEIVTVQNDLLHVFRPNATYLPGFPVSCLSRAPYYGPSPALGDLDGDGKLEIVVPVVPANLAATTVAVYNSLGQVTFSKALGNWTQSSAILADLDGDSSIDIVIAGEEGVVHAWDQSGNDLTGFPIPTGDFVRGTPTYADVDQDGMGDLVLAGWNRLTYVWKMTGAYAPHRAPWPTFQHDMARTGAFDPDFATDTIELAPAPIRLAQWWPNPFNPRVTLRVSVPRGRSASAADAGTHVRADVFDVRGRLVRRLVDEKVPAGSYEHVWDGHDTAGRALPSGVYVYRVEVGDRSATGKIALLR
jgi:hypothetical protein